MSIKLPTIEEIKNLRKAKGITQKKLAERAHVSQSLIARIEGETVDPRLSTLRKIVNAIVSSPEKITAIDIMHTPVISVEADDTVRKAVDTMERYNISQLPVFKNKKVVGSIQELTLVKIILKSREPEKIFSKKIETVMEESFPIIGPSADLDEILELFSHDKPAVLVMDQGKIVGIITKIDTITKIRSKQESR
jgi:predicted transcriptional regulator